MTDIALKGALVNTLFEERLFDLVGALHRIARTLEAGEIPYELVGGLAVLVHVEEADPEHSTLTRDVHLMVNRTDLDRIKDAATSAGFRYRHTAGVDMLLYGPTESVRNAVHLLVSGERVEPSQATPNPPIAPVRKRIGGSETMIIPVAELLRMKLSSFRDKDRVHVRSMDAAGLIAPTVELTLPGELADRLRIVRETE